MLERKKLYVVDKGMGDVTIITQDQLENGEMFDERFGYFELGPEVELKKSVEIVPKNSVYRNETDDGYSSTLDGWKPTKRKI